MNEYDIIHQQSIAIESLTVQNEILKNERDIAVDMLAGWCNSIVENGAGWDYWDEYYKDAAYRDGPIRYLIDVAMEKWKNEIH